MHNPCPDYFGRTESQSIWHKNIVEHSAKIVHRYVNSVQTNLIHIIEKHLPHFEDRNSGIHGTLKPELSNQIWQCTEMGSIRVRQQHGINLIDMSARTERVPTKDSKMNAVNVLHQSSG